MRVVPSAPRIAAAAAIALLARVPVAHGRSLEAEIARIEAGTNVGRATETSFGELLVKLAPMSQALPSTTPGRAMSWDPAAHQFVPLNAPAGPIFTERAGTLGSGALLINATYQDLNFQRLDGHSLHGGIDRYVAGIFIDVRRFELYQRFLVVSRTASSTALILR
jgi:hypothetical protein